MRVTAIIVAAGSSTRFGSDKLLEKLGSDTVLEMSIRAFEENKSVNDIVVVTTQDRVNYIKKLGFEKVRKVVLGGETRADSVKRGMIYIKDTDYVLIHDGARPLVSQRVINDVVSSVFLYGAAAPFTELKESIKIVNDDFVVNTIERSSARAVQTPQGFLYRDYADALKKADGSETDDCQIAEKFGMKIACVNGDYANIKITTREDIVTAKSLLGFSKFRVGHGYDVHTLRRGEHLILCGVKIPFEMGLVGHSDADVAIHAAADAVLGAAALGDIGRHFPDTDDKYKGANSMELFAECCKMAKDKGYSLLNLDLTIVAQQPKLAAYIEEMRANVAAAAEITVDQVNVKATTEEGLGFTGEFKGISAHAVALITLE